MHAAVVEFDSLTDAVGPAAKDHNLGTLVGRRLVLAIVSRIQVGREGLELSAASVNGFEHRQHCGLAPLKRHRSLVEAGQVGNPAIREAILLGLAE